MKFGHPRTWIAVLSLGVVLIVGIVDMRRTAPGPLAAVHERSSELAGMADCSACHGSWFTSMGDACLSCHEPIGSQLDRSLGLHGTLGDDVAPDCARCHSEHHGADFQMVNRQSFVLAGTNPDAFDHSRVGFPMDGRHLELGCVECHENAEVDVLPEGAWRFGGLDRSCATCHEDAHEGSMALDCTACHGQEAFDQLVAPGHGAYLPLVGGHGDVGCRQCHAAETTHALEAVGSRLRPDARDCLDCHESPHDTDFVVGVSRLMSSTPGASCSTCHEADHDDFRSEVTVSPQHHVCSGFGLAAPHDTVECSDCHGDADAPFAERYPGRDADTCAACHEDPHAGQFATGPFAGQGCLACHDRERFEPHAIGIEEHARTALPLTGSHAESECSACHHVADDSGVRFFHGTPAACRSCHDDAHDGYFDRRAARRPELANAECSQCHRTTTFADVAEDGFDHQAWTGFAVRAAHAESDCEACHQRSPVPDPTGRTLGRVADHFGPLQGCATCHTDPHEGAFDQPSLPAEVDGRSQCLRCHTQSSFRTFPDGFDHRLWTGFALQGVHDELGCSACHEPLRAPDASRRTWGHAAGTACADCHADPHAGQFRLAGREDCADCHRAAREWSELRFDHDLDARFPLGDAHAALDCVACHESVAVGDVDIVRYRPLPTECIDCHGVHEDVLLRRRGSGR